MTSKHDVEHNLQDALNNYTFYIDNALTRLSGTVEIPGHYFNICYFYRGLAPALLLAYNDRKRFVDYLCRSGQARLAFLQEAKKGLACEPKYTATSKNVAFGAALAAGDFETARGIAQLSPTEHREGIETEDKFFLCHFPQRLLAAPEDHRGHEEIIKRWETLEKGKESGSLIMFRALLKGTPKELTAAFDRLVKGKLAALKEYAKGPKADEQFLATEGKVFIDGLAVLKLAEFRGTPVKLARRYAIVPEKALVPKGTPISPPDAWRGSPNESLEKYGS